ncbi:MAG: twin-arginine translocase subunit TatC, partial [Bryobacteraceae bacterium]
GYDDPYAYDPYAGTSNEPGGAVTKAETPPPPPVPPAPPGEGDEEHDPDEEGMLRMSFMEHLEELRTRIFHVLLGIGVAFVASLTFSEELYYVVREPAHAALRNIGLTNPTLTQISPGEAFNVIWIKLPIITAIFISSPWILYQVWGFIAPGLYRRERRFAAPFILCSAGLFIAGGLFAYFVVFRYGLTFLLGIGRDVGITPIVTVSEYFDLFVNVILGVAIVFELPILIFFLTLLRIASPRFLLRNSRYAILCIVLMAAVVTPTPDVFNLVLFSAPMIALYFVGLFASYMLVLNRENRRFPWRTFLYVIGIPLLLVAAGLYIALTRFGYKLVLSWPFLVR